MNGLKAPFPYFGGKSKIASIVWERFGNTPNYVEPFFGSGAVLLGRPHFRGQTETINDLDGFVSNFWRAIKWAPEETARHADWPVNECDLHARHIRLVSLRDEFSDRLMGDPRYFDAEIAGWWVWGLSAWIGSGWCSGKGPWGSVDGKIAKVDGDGCRKQMPHLGDRGRGINRQRPHLNRGCVIARWFDLLSDRMRDIRVCCGNWSRILGRSPTEKIGITSVFLDPPYSAKDRADCYAKESYTVAHDVQKWCLENGDNPKLRIALCGYFGDYDLPGWDCVRWKTSGGYGGGMGTRGDENKTREVIYFSPHCLKAKGRQMRMFE